MRCRTVDQRPQRPAHYWKGTIPQVVVLDGAGKLHLDADGQVSLEIINAAVSEATGLPAPTQGSISMSFNELNTEVISR